MEAIKIVCPACRGEDLPETTPCPAHTGGSCVTCGGDGLIANDVCGLCNGAKTISFGSLSDALVDKINDMSDKLNDILEKVNE